MSSSETKDRFYIRIYSYERRGKYKQRSGNMYTKVKMLIFTVLIMIISAAAVYGDRTDTGWKGYGLYNLNNSQVSISRESDTITIDGAKVNAIYEYTITNVSGKNITVNFGYPDNGITKFSVHDGSKYLSYKTRETSYLKNNYGVQNLQIPDGRWYLFNMVFTPDQTRSIKVSIEAEMKKEENDTYSLSFFKDRNYSYAILSEKADMVIKLTDFKPYSIYELDGIKPEEISEEGEISLSYSGSYGSGLSLRYQPVDRMIIEKISDSNYKKPKAIVKAFNEKKYEDVLTLCDEYISDPADERLSLEQVKYVRTEAIRLLGRDNEYIEAVGQLDIAKLYPARVRYKVFVDRLKAYDAINNEEGKTELLGELIPETQQGYPYLYHWLDKNGYEIPQNDNGDESIDTPSNSPGNNTSGKNIDIIGLAIDLITTLKESRWTYTILGLLVGFILGRITKRGKHKKSVYLFRN